MSRRAALLVGALAMAAIACSPRPRSAPEPAAWSYRVVPPPHGSMTARVLRIEATFAGAGTDRLAIAEEAAARVEDLAVATPSGWRTVARDGPDWREPACVRGCTVRYRLDLAKLAQDCDDAVDCATRVGEATLSPALAWLLHPAPKGDVPVTLRFVGPDADRVVTGLRRAEGGRFVFRSQELDEGSFTAFGPVRRYPVPVGGGTIDMAILGGRFAMNDDELMAWVGEAAQAVANLYGHFPVPTATLFVLPVTGQDEVLFGKVLSLAGASIAVLVGDRMRREQTRADWVLIHELFHLGFPSFRGEGRWLGEGLATYYEPILRRRAGWISEPDLWAWFTREMPRGLPPRGAAAGLVQRDDIDAIYWGGALFALTADVGIRQETRGRHSLDDVVRAALARGGDATHVWTVSDVVRLANEVTGTRVVEDLYARHAARGERPDLDGLWAALGIEPTGDERAGRGTRLRDDRPLAAVRRSIAQESLRP